MPTTLTASYLRFFLLLFVLIQRSDASFGQGASYPIKEWVRKLSSKSAPSLSGVWEILPALANKDSATAVNLFNDLESQGNPLNAYFNSRLNLTKAAYFNGIRASARLIENLLDKSINAAYETDDDSLISEVSWQYGSRMYYLSKLELASLHCLNAAEIDERIDRHISVGKYGTLVDILYLRTIQVILSLISLILESH